MEIVMGIFLNDWDFNNEKDSIKQLMSDFEIKESDLEGIEILLASYVYEDYNGDAFVLLKKGGKLFEINGSHCSCYGLEDQWDMEEADVESLKHRLESGDLGTDWDKNIFKNELIKILDNL